MIRTRVTEGMAADCSAEELLSEVPAWTNLKASQAARRASAARRSSGRRRLVDPATCDRDYSAAEMEFMQAMQEYKKDSGRMFPTWSEVLEVLHRLGYEKSVHDSAPLPSHSG